jgi:hypothetical protein
MSQSDRGLRAVLEGWTPTQLLVTTISMAVVTAVFTLLTAVSLVAVVAEGMPLKLTLLSFPALAAVAGWFCWTAWSVPRTDSPRRRK